jgi:glycosyltransferase involved in cell wall biosynthesis
MKMQEIINTFTLSTLMVSTSYPADLEDWRGLFIRHLSDALARRNDLAVKLWSPPGQTDPNIENAATLHELAWLSWLMQQGGIAHLLRNGGIRRFTAPIKLLGFLRQAYSRNRNVGLYHINWLQNALPVPNNGIPLLVTVLGTDMQLLKLPLIITLLKHKFRQHPTVICPNAEWMIAPLQEAFGSVAKIKFVPFGIDSAWFELERKLKSCEYPLWIVVTRLTKAKLGPLFEWCEPHFRGQPRQLYLLGPMQEQIDIPNWVHYCGPVSPKQLEQNWFPRAQGLITLSRHAEGRPQVMLEAMAAGLPILASRLPAHENIVFNGNTGWICDSKEQFATNLNQLESIEENICLGQNARAWVAREIGTWDDCAGRYNTAYREIV